MTDDLRWLDATDHAALVHTGAAAARELTEAAIARIDALDPALKAVCWRSLAQADDPALPDGPFRGVPLLLKDTLAHLAGDRVTHGSARLLRHDWRSPHTSALGRYFLDAGVTVPGRTSCPAPWGGRWLARRGGLGRRRHTQALSTRVP